VSKLSIAQLERKRRASRNSQRVHRERERKEHQQTQEQNRQLGKRVRELETELNAAKSAIDNNSIGLGMPMALGRNTGIDIANTKWPIGNAFENKMSTRNFDKHSDTFSHDTTQQLWESSTTVASDNLYTNDLNNSFYEGYPMVRQPLKYRHENAQLKVEGQADATTKVRSATLLRDQY
jgi:hypothetical protein